ncbi:hypothetical protein ACFPOI_54830 [Nonomuraea angiospora]|uniref:Integral membrane protein n=1 Tax=Nonomuraea angiospora TaxID=46172 RepID=A0ABR9M708_9ACTN|nr:hypothetical protein [Nonomuraea angiospora]MBE1588691.1 hypothetical protein [Nonomuraea angiospora]
MEPVDQKRSWFDALTVPQRVVVGAVSAVGLVGGMALLLMDPPQDMAAFLLILAYVISAAAVLQSIPWGRARLGRGYRLWLGFALTFKSLSGELTTPAFQVAGLIVLAVIRDRRLRQGDQRITAQVH